MSKNFEVLLRAEKGAELLQAASVGPELLQIEQPRVRPPVHIDEKVRVEEAKLVERVFVLPGQPPRLVVFCGVESLAGTAGICARAGQHLAEQTRKPVCLVDADLHSPRMHDYFCLDNHSGLARALSQTGPIRNFMHSLDGMGLSLLPAGSRCEDGSSPWKSERWLSRLHELRREFQYVLILAPPAAQYGDAALLGQETDGVILILESNQTRRETARIAAQNLTAAKVQVLGAVLNNRTFPIPESIYRKL